MVALRILQLVLLMSSLLLQSVLAQSDPTLELSNLPTALPTPAPTILPTPVPTIVPTTPTLPPTMVPSYLANAPTPSPSARPTPEPTTRPTQQPSNAPTPAPSIQPTTLPTVVPTALPTQSPTYLPGAPTALPTLMPSSNPSPKPTTSSQPTIAIDGADPKIISWTLDLSVGYMSLTLDKKVTASTLKVSRLSIINARSPSYPFDTAVYITGYKEESFMGLDLGIYDPSKNTTYSIIYFYLQDTDYAALMFNPTTANNPESSWLVARQGALSTEVTSGRPTQEINQLLALKAETVVFDTTAPFLVKAGIDYDLGLITLWFSEPIGNGGIATGDASVEGLAIQSARDCSQYGPGYSCALYLNLVVSSDVQKVSVDDYARKIVFNIGSQNLNSLKKVSGVANSVSNTYFSLWKPIANDTNGNIMSIYGVERSSGLQAEFFVPDNTPPILKYWVYDCAAGAISLVFDEPIDPDYFNYSTITILSSNSSSSNVIRVRIDDVSSDLLSVQKDFSEKLTIQFSSTKLETIFSTPGILTAKKNSFLILGPRAVTDTSDNKNVYRGLDATSLNPLMVGIYAPDTVPPQLVSAGLDMKLKILTMQFTKVVNISTIALSEMSLQTQSNSKGATALSFSRERASIITASGSKVIQLLLTDTMFANMKLLGVGTAISNSYIYFSRKFVSDRTVLANRVVEITASAAFRVSTYVADSVKPVITSWYADMGLEKLYITFSEPVDISNNAFYIQVSSITLRDDVIENPSSVSFTLTTSSYVSSTSGSAVEISLGSNDAINIKSKSPLCIARDRCFLSHTSELARDLATYDPILNTPVINQIASAETFIQASTNFIADIVQPKLLSYTFSDDYNGFCTLELTFNEPVKSQFLDPTGITISKSNPAAMITLSSSSFSPESNAVVVHIYVSSYDYIRMKLAYIGYSKTSALIRVASKTVVDIAGNQLDGANGAYIEPSSFYEDTKLPSLVALSFNTIQNGLTSSTNLTVYFNDVVKVVDGGLSQFVLFSSSSGNKMSLANAKTVYLDHAAAVIVNLDSVMSSISKAGLLASQADTNLYIARSGSVIDEPNKNEISRMVTSSGIRMGQRFLSFRLDLARGLLYLTTAYPFDRLSIWDPTLIFLTSIDTGARVPFGITDSFNKTSPDTVLVSVSSTTLNKFKESIAFDDASKITLSLGEKAFADSRGIFLYSSHAINCVQLLSDTVAPDILSFKLDLGLGTITLSFSKVVQVSLVNLAYLTLRSAVSEGAETVTISLVNGVVVTSALVPSSAIVISLNGGSYPTLRDSLNMDSKIGKQIDTTFVVIGKNFVGDTAKSPNYVLPTVRKADAVVTDTVKPQLQSWTIDLDAHILRVTFDEAVNPSSNIAGSYLLLKDPAVPSVHEMFLSTSTTDTTVTGNTALVKISSTDLNNMYRMTPNLCTKGGIALEGGNCFLSIRQNAISDIVGNGIAGVVRVFATLPPSIFKPDATPPVLTNYSLSIQDGLADFYFDKVVDCKSVKMNSLILQFDAFLGSKLEYYQMTKSAPNCDAPNLRFDTQFHLEISYEDLTNLKTFDRLFKSRQFAWARPNQGFVVDSFGNSNVAVQDGSALQPGKFYPDTVKPRLISFTISSSKEVYLFFTEPMLLSSMDVSQLAFLDKQFPGTKFRWNLAAAVVKSADSTRMQFIISLGSDYTLIAANSPIFNYQDQTLLMFGANFARDTSGNPILPISNSTALEYGPSILAWDLDLVTGRLVIDFPESMRSPFIPEGVGFQSNIKLGVNDSFVKVTTNSPFIPIDSSLNTSFVVTLSNKDLNRIKYYGVAASSANSYLTTPFRLSTSSYKGTLLPYLGSVERDNQHALKVRFLTADSRSPVILSFQLNLNKGKLYLLMDEPVQLSSVLVSGMTLVGEEGSYAVLTYRSGISLKIRNITEVEVSLCSADLNYIKLATKTGQLTRLIVAKGAFSDLSNNPYLGNSQDSPVFAIAAIPDVSPPFITNATLSMATGVLQLSFNEIVDVSSINNSKIYIGSSNSFDQSSKYQLTVFTIVEELPDWTISLDLKTYRTDYEGLQHLNTVATSVSNTFLFLSDVKDIFGNQMMTRATFQATSVAPDVSPLAIIAFDYVSASKTFTFYFTKDVQTSTFDCSDFRLISSASTSPATSFDFQKSSCVVSTSTASSTIIVFTYSGTVSPTFSESSSCFLHVPIQGKTRQLSGSSLAALSAQSALQLGFQLSNALLDVNSRVITLLFSKDVLFSTLKTENLGFYSSVSGRSFYLQSTVASSLLPSPQVDSAAIHDKKGLLTLGVGDMNLLKALDIEPNKLYIISKDGSDASGLIRDSNNVKMATAAITSLRDSQLVSKITKDNVPPQILRLTTSIGQNLIKIDFDEPIRASSVVVTNLLFQADAFSTAVSYKLTGGSVVSGGNSVNITLSTVDSEAIKLKHGLLKNAGSAYLSFAFKMAADYAGNYVATIKSTSAWPVDLYVTDSVRPLLISFTLDMTKTLLILSFSEPVVSKTFNVSGIALQSRFYSKDGAVYNLTGGTLLSGDSSTIQVQLTEEDVFNIKNTKGLCRNAASTYLVLASKVATDIAGNSVMPIPDRLAQLVSKFTFDTTLPTITQVTVDVNLGRIYVHFSELVQLLMVASRGLVVYSSSATTATTTKRYTLTSSSTVELTGLYSKVVQVNLSPRDFNTIKFRTPLLHSKETSFFTISAEFAQDTFFNPVVAVSTPIQASSYTPDKTVPTLLVYSLDMQQGIVTLQFSESMFAPSLDLSQFTIQSNRLKRYGVYVTFAGSSSALGADVRSTTLTVQFSSTTFTNVKYLGIGKTASTGLLSWAQKSFTDQFGNNLPPNWDASIAGFEPKAPDTFIADTTAPILARWQLDRTAMIAYLYFDEPVVLKNATMLTLHTGPQGVYPQPLSKGIASIVNGTYNTIIALNLRDFCAWPALKYPCVAAVPETLTSPKASVPDLGFFAQIKLALSDPLQKLYLSVRSGAFVDFAYVPNAVNEISSLVPLREGSSDCSPCPDGQFAFKLCTPTNDRVCKPCSACDPGSYLVGPCSAVANTICKPCSSCQFNTYVSESCAPAKDTVCSSCTICSAMEYEAQRCELGKNTICSTCMKCTFADASIQSRCENGPWVWWQMDNCCVDDSGVNTACNLVDFANMANSAKRSRQDGLKKIFGLT